jgi:hypothetical protein
MRCGTWSRMKNDGREERMDHDRQNAGTDTQKPHGCPMKCCPPSAIRTPIQWANTNIGLRGGRCSTCHRGTENKIHLIALSSSKKLLFLSLNYWPNNSRKLAKVVALLDGVKSKPRHRRWWLLTKWTHFPFMAKHTNDHLIEQQMANGCVPLVGQFAEIGF